MNVKSSKNKDLPPVLATIIGVSLAVVFMAVLNVFVDDSPVHIDSAKSSILSPHSIRNIRAGQTWSYCVRQANPFSYEPCNIANILEIREGWVQYEYVLIYADGTKIPKIKESPIRFILDNDKWTMLQDVP